MSKGLSNPFPTRRERDLAREIHEQLDGRVAFAADDKEIIREILCEYRHEILRKVELTTGESPE